MLVALCAILNIEEVMGDKVLIFNSTSQNDVIKVSMGSFTKNICELWRLTFINENFFSCNALLLHLSFAQSKHSKLNLSRHKNQISFYYVPSPQSPKLILMANLVLELSLTLAMEITLKKMK